jgi:phage FluMu protein Com
LVEHEWHCTHCGKLLGVLKGMRLHIRFSHGHEYLVGFPATSTCRGCRTLNEFALQEEGHGNIAHSEAKIRN